MLGILGIEAGTPVSFHTCSMIIWNIRCQFLKLRKAHSGWHSLSARYPLQVRSNPSGQTLFDKKRGGGRREEEEEDKDKRNKKEGGEKREVERRVRKRRRRKKRRRT